MNKRKKLYIFSLAIIFIILIFYTTKEILKINENTKKNEMTVIRANKKIFKNELMEDVLNRLKENCDEFGINLEDISLIKSDNRTYLKVGIKDIPNSDYLIHYEGMNVTKLYANISKVDENNLDKISLIVGAMIKTSDHSMTTVDAVQIYSELLTSINKNKNVSQLKLKNGLIYSLEVTETQGIIVIIK